MKGFLGFSIFTALSVLLHLVLILIFWFLAYPSAAPIRGGGGEVTVEMIAGSSSTDASSRKSLPGSAANRERQVANLPSGSGTGSASPGTGSGPVSGADNILAEIRARIERAKRYPLLARKFGVEGRSLVRFQINTDGKPETVSLKSTSGSKLLDDEAIETIRRAAPYPLYADPLEIWIRFELNP